jgi:hypothetical protein
MCAVLWAHPDSGIELYAIAIPEGGNIVVDGDLSEWAGFPEAATVTTDMTYPHVCEGADCEVVPEDFDWIIKIAWSESENKLYFGVQVHDDVWLLPENVGERSLHKWDDLEPVTDADNSGGITGSVKDEEGHAGRYGQQWYFSAGAPGEGTRMEVIYLGTEGEVGTWPGQPPYGESAFQFDAATNTGYYEGSLVLFDFMCDDGPDCSIVHDLTEGEAVGFGFLYDEIDQAPGTYDAQWKTAPGTKQWGNGNEIPDLELLPPSDWSPAVAVESNTWGQVKSLLK